MLTNQTSLAPGLLFNATATKAAIPWIELLTVGTFTEKTLSAIPESFQVSALWIAKLEHSAKTHGWTWLHHLYIGTALLEQGQQQVSAGHFEASLALKPNVHAARALAVSAPDIPTARIRFLEAWEIYELAPKTDPAIVHLGTNLAMELSIWLGYQGMWADLRELLQSKSLIPAMRLKVLSTKFQILWLWFAWSVFSRGEIPSVALAFSLIWCLRSKNQPAHSAK